VSNRRAGCDAIAHPALISPKADLQLPLFPGAHAFLPHGTALAFNPADYPQQLIRRPTVFPTELTALERQTFRRRLREMTERLAGGVVQLESEVEREPAGAAARSELAAEEVLLAEARAALERLDGGRFGRCEHCGRAIGRHRLEVVPHARYCVRCEREAERPAG
jgi:RNA polymerase-binding transcription factor DksA